MGQNLKRVRRERENREVVVVLIRCKIKRFPADTSEINNGLHLDFQGNIVVSKSVRSEWTASLASLSCSASLISVIEKKKSKRK